GINYAEQPTGKLRFNPVQWPSASFNGTREAKSGGKFCIQYVKTELAYGEDRLNLNVYRPSVVSLAKKLLVLVYDGSMDFVCYGLARASYRCDLQLQSESTATLANLACTG
ncbi:uncharacterized protein LY79DRAFT_512893, partial [Colletotrichum navitas]